jgi:hypothetical protein
MAPKVVNRSRHGNARPVSECVDSGRFRRNLIDPSLCLVAKCGAWRDPKLNHSCVTGLRSILDPNSVIDQRVHTE